MITIAIVDMEIRDERVLEWMKLKADDDGILQVSSFEIAAHFGCHRNTALAILRRLRLSGHISVVRLSYSGGKVYRINKS